VKNTRRSFLRTYREVPVEIRQYGSVKRLYGKMNDCCRGGMQLKTEQYLVPGSPIFIRSRIHGEVVPKGIVGEGCPAKVLWCRPLSDREAGWFTVGVQFTPLPNDRQPLPKQLSETDE